MNQLNSNKPVFKHNYLDQNKLHILSEKTMDKFEGLLDYLDIKVCYTRKMYYGCCPIHGGNKWNALNIFHTGTSYRGNWQCHTMQCEREFKNSIIGFTRGVLSHQEYGWSGPGDKTVSFNDTVEFLLAFVNEDYDNIKIDLALVEKNRFINSVPALQPTTQHGITRQQIRNSLKIPPKYYQSRGYSTGILDKYDVGLCDNPKKPMFNRIVIPIYDADNKYVGCTGRSIFERCEHCKTWHGPIKCPSQEEKRLPQYTKWCHSGGFKGQRHLYNYYNAKKYIRKSGVAVIVEGPGDVWRLEEAGIHNGVALFGTALSDGQQILLDSSGAMSLILLTDNGPAGRSAIGQIGKQCERTYYLHSPPFNKEDIGEMSVSEVKTELKPYIDKVITDLGI